MWLVFRNSTTCIGALYHSSPALTFIMSLFNVRLGWWLGNPKKEGVFDQEAPTNGGMALIEETLGMTDDKHDWIYLSDGGHFDNLGLYEMIVRRCRHIVVCDAGADPCCTFEDLANAIRKVRIDLGISIVLEKKMEIYPRQAAKPGQYWAIYRIHYPTPKNSDGHSYDGRLLYIKPAFYGKDEPTDVYNYALESETFPHETTFDQFFSESQFESYRALGQHIFDQIERDATSRGKKITSIEELIV